MSALTTLGLVHTAISVVALAAGLVALVLDKRITWRTALGKVYVCTTVLTCITALGIFQHGGFGKPHALAILTLIAVAVALAAVLTPWFGGAAGKVEALAYSLTILFHFIPAITETSTRLPQGAPIFENADAPGLKAATAVLVLLFLIGATLQLRYLKRTASRI
ncbi:hypothetical protein [Silvimonas sp.]|uniref:hypothetical protein n=1 Tax=Silvimonas sp. TaxID=2650811 RepID=UPI002847B6E4|nr:hypothetical protein [Silvimonas sp.]MDR3427076.1 hypothetical protein [Silvimonas sp.]